MKALFFGDIIGKPGREAVKKILPKLREKHEPDLVFANGENLSHGKGVSEESLGQMKEAGIDWFTSGNHVFARKGAIEILENKKWPVLRPANWGDKIPGRGWELIELRAKKILLINLIGRVFMNQQFDDPFACADRILEEYSLEKEDGKEQVAAIIVDWHAEATSEKIALGWHLDGKVSAVLGTHTHVQTADDRVLPQGTAYISDIGMVGVRDSVLGADKDIILRRFLTQMPYKIDVAEGDVLVNAVVLELDDKTGLAKNVEKIREIVEF